MSDKRLSIPETALEALHKIAATPKFEPDRARIVGKIQAGMVPSGNESYSRWRLPRWVGYSVASSAVFLLSVVAILNFSPNSPETVSVPKIYKTMSGQRASVTLADGSTVTLAPATILRATGRTVDLTGQAIFTINPKAESPFIVRVGNISTTVLGTTFSVRKYQSDATAKVVVAQGRVSMSGVVLATGDIGVSSGGSVQVTRNASITSELTWADGKLVFNEEILRNVIPELERWYGIQITADSSLFNKRVIVTLNTESSAEAVKLISTILGVSSEIRGSRAIIYSH